MDYERDFTATASVLVCPLCGSEVAPTLLSCPSCHRLIHADRLKELAGSAEASERAEDLGTALGYWRQAITLLPPESRQHSVISARIVALSRRVESAAGPKAPPPFPDQSEVPPVNPHDRSRWSGRAITGTAGTLALLAWKFKFLAVLLLTKAKFLLLGLTKASTFLSMLAAFGFYWTVFGAPFAMGFVLSIYIHEMGHVAALMRYGVPASAPLFIPGFGALIRLRQSFIDPREDARIGLAGPIWGCGAALVCTGLYLLSEYPLWGALALVGAWINLFNLIPIWQLDGSRAFHSLNRPQRWLAVTAVATAWALTTQEGHHSEAGWILPAIMAVGAFRAAADKPAAEPDRGALVQYMALVAILSALSILPVHIAGR
jgi:Zn-dependent protease